MPPSGLFCRYCSVPNMRFSSIVVIFFETIIFGKKIFQSEQNFGLESEVIVIQSISIVQPSWMKKGIDMQVQIP